MRHYIVTYSKKETASSEFVEGLKIEVDANNDIEAESKASTLVRNKSIEQPYQVLIDSVTRNIKH